jgi:hypothetical protein
MNENIRTAHNYLRSEEKRGMTTTIAERKCTKLGQMEKIVAAAASTHKQAMGNGLFLFCSHYGTC